MKLEYKFIRYGERNSLKMVLNCLDLYY